MITKLPVLNTVLQAASTLPSYFLKNSVFVCVQHLLFTSIDLFKALIALGAMPENIFLIGKQYSTCQEVAKQLKAFGIQLQPLTPLTQLGEYATVFTRDVSLMWQEVKRHIQRYSASAIIVLDDGGKCLECIVPGMLDELPVIGIEQTTAGLFNPTVLNLHVPFIDVAASAAKVYLESNLIVEAILKKLEGVLPNKKTELACGVVGLGIIGTAVARQLSALGCKVYGYEKNKSVQHVEGVIECENLENLIACADYIFGCTGRDITENLSFNNLIHQDKVFISCTSEDKEFLTLLKWINTKNQAQQSVNPLNTIQYRLSNGATIYLIKGGFPINFDDSGESVPAQKVQLTRGLLLAALIQAATYTYHLNNPSIKGRTMLNPQAQKFVAKAWFKANPDQTISKQLFDAFEDIEWIAKNSGGVFCESAFIEQCFTKPLLEKSLVESVD